jgi:hypothetical protein
LPTCCSVREQAPPLALPGPVRLGRDRPQLPLRHRFPFSSHQRQEQDRLLNIRREVQQVDDLAHPGAGDLAEFGDVCEVGHLAAAHEVLEPDRQRHQP